MRTVTAFILALATFAILAAPAMATEVVVIVSSKNPTMALSNNEAADIFLGKSASFPGGGKAVPLDLAEGSAARDAFYIKTSGKVAPQLLAYWSKRIFTGQGRPPMEAKDGAAVKKMVADNPSLVAYIDKSQVDASVKVVLTLP